MVAAVICRIGLELHSDAAAAPDSVAWSKRCTPYLSNRLYYLVFLMPVRAKRRIAEGQLCAACRQKAGETVKE
jgi:hypothetical protein